MANMSVQVLKSEVKMKSGKVHESFTFVVTNSETGNPYMDSAYFEGVNYESYNDAMGAGTGFAKAKQYLEGK